MQLRKEKKVTFEDDMPNMKTKTNHSLLAQTTENRKRMKYSEQTVKFIVRVIEDLGKNTTEEGASFEHSFFKHIRLKSFGREGRDSLTKDMD